MTHLQYRKATVRLGLTHVRAAELWGVTLRHEMRFASGDSPVPGAVAVLVCLLLDGVISVEDIRSRL